jgi:hypothetical protein
VFKSVSVEQLLLQHPLQFLFGAQYRALRNAIDSKPFQEGNVVSKPSLDGALDVLRCVLNYPFKETPRRVYE